MLALHLKSLNDTQLFADALVSVLQGEELVYLSGDLGAGKTALVKCVGKALGYQPEYICSPTFIYFNLHEHEGEGLNLFHADLYRLNHIESLDHLVFWEYVQKSKTIAFVEWASKFKELGAVDHLHIKLDFLDNPEHRKVEIYATSEKYELFCEKMKNVLYVKGLTIV